MALYRKYRPSSFAEVVGQDHVTKPLSVALESRDASGRPDRINHAYLFSGPRGCGKTSSARILARSLNCVEGPTATPCGKCASCRALAPGGPGNLDVVELDAASHNSVDDMRELRDTAIYQPAESRYRIYVIDEAHMISAQGFNALLKIVEEPPEHLIFIFATTEPERVLQTIRSRTHHYPFRLLTPPDMRGLLERVVESESVQVAPDVYPLVIGAGGGSPRDSLSVLDQLVAGAGDDGVTYDEAAQILGVTDKSVLADAVSALAASDRAALFGVVDRVIVSGQDPQRFAADLLTRIRDLLVLSAVPDAADAGLVDIPEDQLPEVREQASSIAVGSLTRFAQILDEGLERFRGATSPRLLLEVMAARMLLPGAEQSVEALWQRVESLERGERSSGSGAVAAGSGTQAPAPVQQAQAQPAPTAEQAPEFSEDELKNLSPLQRARLRSKKAGDFARSQMPSAASSTAPAAPAAPAAIPKDLAEDAGADTAATSPKEVAAKESAPQEPAPKPQASASGGNSRLDQWQAAKEASRRAQELARQQDRIERERIAKQQEAAQRAAEGLPAEPEQEAASDAGYEPQPEAKPEQPATSEIDAVSEASEVEAEDPASDTFDNASQNQPEPAEQQEPQQEPQQEHQLTVESLTSQWPKVLESISGQHATAARVLATQARPVAVDGNQVFLQHHTGALANRLSTPEYSQALSAAIESQVGVAVSLDISVGSGRGSKPQPERTAEQPTASAESSSAAKPEPANPEPAKPATPEPEAKQQLKPEPEPAPKADPQPEPVDEVPLPPEPEEDEYYDIDDSPSEVEHRDQREVVLDLLASELGARRVEM